MGPPTAREVALGPRTTCSWVAAAPQRALHPSPPRDLSRPTARVGRARQVPRGRHREGATCGCVAVCVRVRPDPNLAAPHTPTLSQLAARASLEPQRVWLGTSEPAAPRLGHCLPALTSRRVGGANLTNPSTATERLQSVSHYHTPSKEHMAHTHTLLWSSFQVCGGYLCIFQCRCIFFFLLEGRRTSGWSSAPFTFYLSSCWRRSCRERTSVMNRAPAGSCDPTRRGRTPLGRRNHRPRGPNHPPLSPNLQGNPNR